MGRRFFCDVFLGGSRGENLWWDDLSRVNELLREIILGGEMIFGGEMINWGEKYVEERWFTEEEFFLFFFFFCEIKYLWVDDMSKGDGLPRGEDLRRGKCFGLEEKMSYWVMSSWGETIWWGEKFLVTAGRRGFFCFVLFLVRENIYYWEMICQE